MLRKRWIENIGVTDDAARGFSSNGGNSSSGSDIDGNASGGGNGSNDGNQLPSSELPFPVRNGKIS